MFKSITDRLQRRLERLKVTQTKTALVRKLVDRFILETYQASLPHETSYDPEEKEVLITTVSKTTASDLSLRTHELGALLRKNNIPVSRLTIR